MAEPEHADQKEIVSDIVSRILSKKNVSAPVATEITGIPNEPLSRAFRRAFRNIKDTSSLKLEPTDTSFLTSPDLKFNLSAKQLEDGTLKWDLLHKGQLAQDIPNEAINKWFNDSNFLSTGLIPSNLKFVHKFMNRIRMVLEIPPGINMVWWGESESSNKNTYMLATPYRFVIADFMMNDSLRGSESYQMWGARIFYSVKPLTNWDQILYHSNFNNINCTGYNQTGIGWVCLYHRNEKLVSLKDMVNCIMNRVGGGEAYNEANMRHTQGTTFYKERRPRLKYLHTPEAWEKKSNKYGVGWTLDEKIWVPVIPNDRQLQYMHVDKKGIKPLTIGEAVFSIAPTYYTHKGGAVPQEFVDSMLQSYFCDYNVEEKPQNNLFNNLVLGS